MNAAILRPLWPPVIAAFLATLAYSAYLYFCQRRHDEDPSGEESEEDEEVRSSNPFELGPAIKFGLIYALILLISKTGQMYLGDPGRLHIRCLEAGSDPRRRARARR